MMQSDEEEQPLMDQLQQDVEQELKGTYEFKKSPRKDLSPTKSEEELKDKLSVLEAKVEEMEEARSNEMQAIKDKIDELEEARKNYASSTGQAVSMRTIQQQQQQQQSKGTGRAFTSFLNRSSTTSDGLSLDTFALMMTSRVFSWAWVVGIVTFVFQMILIVMIGADQIQVSAGSSLFNVPYTVDGIVRAGQLLSIIFCVARQSDLITSIRFLVLFYNDPYWDKTILGKDDEDPPSSRMEWYVHIVIPNCLKALQGILVLIITCIIIVQSDNIIDLLKDFTALMVLSETDNVVFGLAVNGYLGSLLQLKTTEVRRIKLNELDDNGSTSASPASFIYRPAFLLLISAGMIGVWMHIVINQVNGTYFRDRYPNCHNASDSFEDFFKLVKEHFGDGTCYGGPLNTLGCGFEGDDCINFNLAYPLCKDPELINVQARVGDGICDMEFNIGYCNYDGGDCDFAKKYPNCGYTELGQKEFGDGKCYGGPLNTLECEFEGGDCINFNLAYPLCRGEKLVNVQDKVGDGVCHEELMISECDFDGGDCCPFEVMRSPMFGDDQCNGGIISSEGCGYDNGDCSAFHRAHPDCPLEAIANGEAFMDVVLGNGICESGAYSSLECGYEFGDCGVGQVGQDVKLEGIPVNYMNTELSLDGGTVAIGLPYAASTIDDGPRSPGLVKLYRYHNTVQKWLQLGNHSIEGEGSGDGFGSSMAMNGSGTRFAIGSLSYVKIFELDTTNGNDWRQIGQMIQEHENGEKIRRNIGMTEDGQRLAIAAPSSGGAIQGAIRIYDLLNSSSEPTWVQVGGDIVGKAAFENIGFVILRLSSLDGSRVMFSAVASGSAPVRVYAHNSTSNDWVQLGDDIPSKNSKSSSTISADGSRIAIASKTTNANTSTTRGKVEVYDFVTGSNEWNQIGDAIRSSTSSNKEDDSFGHSMTMSADGNLLAISSLGVGCDGTLVANLDSCAGTGSVELFVYDSNASYYNREYVRVPSTRASPDVDDHVLRERIHDRERNIFGWRLSMDGNGSILAVSGYDTAEDNGFVKTYDLNQLFYTRCVAYTPDRIGDGICQDSSYYNYVNMSLNTTECGFEGGDCLP